jgi:hypothetical protein
MSDEENLRHAFTSALLAVVIGHDRWDGEHLLGAALRLPVPSSRKPPLHTTAGARAMPTVIAHTQWGEERLRMLSDVVAHLGSLFFSS